jgi:hypothetical protein
MVRMALVAAAAFVAALCVGCGGGTVTKINFATPPGSRMVYQKRSYALPGIVPVHRPAEVGKVERADVMFWFPSGGASLEVDGVIQTFGYNESDVDRLSTNTCNITQTELSKMIEGYAVVFEGTSASKQKIYQMTLGTRK